MIFGPSAVFAKIFKRMRRCLIGNVRAGRAAGGAGISGNWRLRTAWLRRRLREPRAAGVTYIPAAPGPRERERERAQGVLRVFFFFNLALEGKGFQLKPK